MLTIPFRLVDYVKISSFCLVLGVFSWTLTSPCVVQSSEAPVNLSKQERLRLDARTLLLDFFASEDFEIHLTVELEKVGKESAELTPSAGVLESEQVKQELMDSNKSDKEYVYKVSSRNWIVGKKTVKKVTHCTRVSNVRAVILLDKSEWDDTRVALAREALSCLLGVDGERGDKLVFLPR